MDIFNYLGVELLALIMSVILVIIIQCYPRSLERGWRQECLAFLNMSPESKKKGGFFSPLKKCQTCQAARQGWAWVPILNLVIASDCQKCHESMPRWPWVVLMVTLITSLFIYISFGLTYKALFIALLTYMLTALAMIDFRDKFLPDDIVYVLMWLGLLLNAFGLLPAGPVSALVGAASFYVLLFLVSGLVSLITARQSLGLGDIKLISAIAAWFGLLHAWIPILFAVGLQFALTLIIAAFRMRFAYLMSLQLPFGPALAVTTWVFAMILIPA